MCQAPRCACYTTTYHLAPPLPYEVGALIRCKKWALTQDPPQKPVHFSRRALYGGMFSRAKQSCGPEIGLIGSPKCQPYFAASPSKRKSPFPPLFPPLILGWACGLLSLTKYVTSDTVQLQAEASRGLPATALCTGNMLTSVRRSTG